MNGVKFWSNSQRATSGIALVAMGCLTAWGSAAGAQADEPALDAKTEVVIRGGLNYLASKQTPNGSWGSTGEEKRHPIAMTGYVLMAFQSAGQLPEEGEHSKTVRAGLQYLIDSVAPDGVIGNRHDGQYMYGHGIASIAIAELYGQSHAPTIRSKLEKAIKLIVACQHPEGGWRYRPTVQVGDISVTVLQVVALRAAKNAGLDVPQATIDRAVGYVKSCYHPQTGGFTYQPNREPGFARTAAAIYSLQVCGLYGDDMVKLGSEYLVKNNQAHQDWFTYGQFYAAPAQYMVGAETWSKWYPQIAETLLDDVNSQGEISWWEPRLDRGRGGVGPVYCTAVYTMILAMPNHYLPLYQR